MTLSSLSAETRTFYSRRYPSRSRSSLAAEATLAVFETLAAPASPPDFDPAPPPPPPPPQGSPYENRFKADLTALHPQDAAPLNISPDLAQGDFLGHLGALIAGLRSGDALGAQAAADALQVELAAADAPPAPAAQDAPARMLEDLRALIAAARRGDVPSAHEAAHRLSRDMQSALTGAPPGSDPAPAAKSAIAEGASAAYDTLMELTEASVTHAA